MFGYHELQNISRNSTTELCDIMFKNYSDKSSLHKHHNYSLLYNHLFSEKKNQPLKILEIGIGSIDPSVPSNMTGGELGRVYRPGASVRGWNEYFSNAEIYCCDIDKSIIDFTEPNIHGFFLDQTDNSTIDFALENILKDVEFDIIIDDGLHWFATNCSVMHKLLSKVKKGGYYIIEDIVHSQFNYRYIEMDKLLNKKYQYVRLPNVHNSVDNNLFIVQC